MRSLKFQQVRWRISRFREFFSKRSIYRLKNFRKRLFYNLKTRNFKLGIRKLFKRIRRITSKTGFVLIKLIPTVAGVFIVIVLIERIRNPKGFLALALESIDNDKKKKYEINTNTIKYFIKYNSRSLQELYYLIQTNNLTFKNTLMYCKRNPKTATFIVAGSLGFATYLTYKLITSSNSIEEIPSYGIAMSYEWQQQSLQLVNRMTDLSIRGNRGKELIEKTKRILMNTLSNEPLFEDAVSTLVENGAGLTAAKGLLNKSNDSIWKRMQELLLVEGSKYVPTDSVPSQLQDFIKNKPPTVVPVPQPIQNILGKTVNVPLSIAELREAVRAVDKFTEHMPTTVPRPTKLNQVLQITKLADNLVQKVEAKKLVDVAEMVFVYSLNDTDISK